jgi:hypothetical protein
MVHHEHILVAEFPDHEEARAVSHTLKSEGIDLGDVAVHGSAWLDTVDPGGTRTKPQAALLGAFIGGLTMAILAAFIGIVTVPHEGSGTDVTFHIFFAAFMGCLFGAIFGATLGWVYDTIALSDHMPDWVPTEYGDDMRAGKFLLMVHGDDSTLARVRRRVEAARPLSLRLHE